MLTGLHWYAVSIAILLWETSVENNIDEFMKECWEKYQATQDIQFLIDAVEEAPFFGQKEMAMEIGRLLRDTKVIQLAKDDKLCWEELARKYVEESSNKNDLFEEALFQAILHIKNLGCETKILFEMLLYFMDKRDPKKKKGASFKKNMLEANIVTAVDGYMLLGKTKEQAIELVEEKLGYQPEEKINLDNLRKEFNKSNSRKNEYWVKEYENNIKLLKQMIGTVPLEVKMQEAKSGNIKQVDLNSTPPVNIEPKHGISKYDLSKRFYPEVVSYLDALLEEVKKSG